MLVFIQVVRCHDSPSLTLLHGSLESRQIDFIESAVIDNHICGVAVHLLVVEGIVLHAGSYAIALHTLDVGHHHLCCQIRVFAHILKVAAVERSAVNVHTGAKNHSLFAVTSLFTNRDTIEQRQVAVPRSCKASESRESHARIVGPAGLVPLVPLNLGANAVRSVGHPHLGNTKALHTGRAKFRLGMAHSHFLLKGHALEGILHAHLNGLAVIEIGGDAIARNGAFGQMGGYFSTVCRERRSKGRCTKEAQCKGYR